MKEKILAYWKQKPLQSVLWLAFILRLPAVFFSKGFGWHDDHFLIIESSQSWVDGTDYDNWFPWSGATTPDGHSLFYSGLHFIFFTIVKWIGIHDPQLKMFFVRLIHALFSLLIVYFGYKIVEFYKGKESASITGLLLASYWFMPFLSVHNLAEFACIPFLLWGTWLALPREHQQAKNLFLAGFILALAVSVRYQSLIIAGGVVLALLIKKDIKASLIVFAGCIVSFMLIQAPFDYMIWGKPFAEFGEYIKYNLDNSEKYGINTWYSYLLVILGMLVPPISFFLFFGYLKTWKKYTIIFLPSFIFLVFHSYFPNKQERFIITIVPLVIIGGMIGLSELYEQFKFSSMVKGLFKGCIWFAVIINFIALPFVSTMYSKRARVESMYYLSKYKNIKTIVVEDRKRDGIKIPPEFYSGQWLRVAEVRSDLPVDSLALMVSKLNESEKPRFVLFFENYDLEKRVDEMKGVFSKLTYETTVKPGFIDWLLNRINPKNANEEIFIYKTNVVPYETFE